MLLTELERLVEAGLSPLEALRAATSAPRAVTGRGPGRIAAGEAASLLIVDGDPTRDISALRRLDGLILRGRLIDSAALAALRASAD